MPDDSFVASERLQIIIPYSDFEKMVKVVQEVEEIKRQYAQLQDQYAAIKFMFSQFLDSIRDIKEFVKD